MTVMTKTMALHTNTENTRIYIGFLVAVGCYFGHWTQHSLNVLLLCVICAHLLLAGSFDRPSALHDIPFRTNARSHTCGATSHVLFFVCSVRFYLQSAADGCSECVCVCMCVWAQWVFGICGSGLHRWLILKSIRVQHMHCLIYLPRIDVAR